MALNLGTLSAIIDADRRPFRKAVTGVKNDLRALGSDVRSRLAGVAGMFRKSGQDSGDGLADGIGDGTRKANDEIDKFVRDSSGRLRDLKGRFASEGKNAGDGLVGGIGRALADGVGDLGSSLTKLIGGNLAGALSGSPLLTAALAALALAAASAAASIGVLGTAISGLAIGGLIGVVGTLAVAFDGMGAAFGAALGDDPEAFSKSLEGLAPPAAAAATALRALKPALDALKMAVQGEFFLGMADDIAALGAVLIGPLQQGMVQVAGSMRNFVGMLGGVIGSTTGVEFLKTVFSSMSVIISSLQGPVAEVMTGMMQAGIVVAPLFEQLGGIIGGIVEQFGTWLSTAAASGDLFAWAETGLQMLSGLLDIFGALGSAMMNFGLAAGPGIAAFIDGIAGMMQAIAPVMTQMGEAVGQIYTAIAPLLPVIGELAAALIGVLAGVFSAVAPLVEGLASAFSSILEPLVPIITMIGETLASAIGPIADTLGSVFADLGPIIGELVGALGGALAPVFETLAEVVAMLAPVLGEIIGQLAEAFLPIITQIVEALGTILPPLGELIIALVSALLPVITALLPVFVQLVSSIGGTLVEAIVALMPLIMAIIQVLVKVVEALTPVITLIAELAGWLLGLLAEGIGFIVGLIGELIEILAGLATGLVDALGDGIDAVVDFVGEIGDWFAELPGVVGGALADLVDLLVETGSDMVEGMVQGIQDLGSMIGDAIMDLVKGAWEEVKSFFGISSPSRLMAWAGRMVVGGFINSLKAGRSLVRRASDDLNKAMNLAGTGDGLPLPGGGRISGSVAQQLSVTATLSDTDLARLEDLANRPVEVRTENDEVLARSAERGQRRLARRG